MKVVSTDAKQLYEGGHRLDAGYHASEGEQALQVIQHWMSGRSRRNKSRKVARDAAVSLYGRRVDQLKEVCVPGGVFIPGRFKRVFVDAAEHGFPYLTGSSITQAEPQQGAKFLSRRYTTNADELALRERMILITCSGTIGNTVYVNADFQGAVGSPDLIRVVANPKAILPGYLFAFISSPLGRALITQKTYGAVIPHIEAHHIFDLPIPRLDSIIEQQIHDLVKRASALKVKANELLKAVQNQLAEAVGPLETIPKRQNLGFKVNSGSMSRMAAFNNKPSISIARNTIKRLNRYEQLSDVTLRIFHPFRMNMVYVSQDRGVPFLNLSDMMNSRYHTPNFMSPRTQGYADYLLRYGWTLISRDGTIGKVCFVGRYLEGAATNQHISRIVPDTNKIAAGYLYAFMGSPYAQAQIDALIYGSVIQCVYEKDLGTILVPLIADDVMQDIGERVEKAYEDRYEANRLEDEAQSLLKQALELK